MVLVDTSVLIGYLRGDTGPRLEAFDTILERDIPFCISPLTFQEVLQGARDEKEYALLDEYLSSLTLYELKDGRDSFRNAARIYYQSRKKGLTIRSTIDVLIAQTAIEHELFLLHCDRDFDRIGEAVAELKVY